VGQALSPAAFFLRPFLLRTFRLHRTIWFMAHWMVGSLIPLAVWILISGLDDLFVDLVFCWQYLRVRLLLLDGLRWPSSADLDRWPRRRIAIFVPLWHESGVIGKMLEHNLSAIRYDRYDVFLGAYPNDPATIEVVQSLAAAHSNLLSGTVPARRSNIQSRLPELDLPAHAAL
jgi:hypothetical protein